MDWEQARLHWINTEIPDFLAKFDATEAGFQRFEKRLAGACASAEWKAMAMAMAKERWHLRVITTIPR